MAFTRAYYWRAVKALARETGQSVSQARKGNWQEYAQAEKQRRIDAAEKGAATRRQREDEEKRTGGGGGEGDDWIVEEPIDTVGGRIYP